ncbi:MAG TPA: D-alanyl-D-alanine carboxypeptidase/D-alanyl-D-alanine-endopeptidase [Longimicrobiaceae bacterium]|nr:D-alanyl-D-alanine carboxypeptidase/D-alanyl-D-alanine-endopeptidase [Longimicrobiaceae bacterium]
MKPVSALARPALLLLALALATAAPAARGQGATNVAPLPAGRAAALAERIDSILMRPALRRADWGIEVREAGSGRLLYARDAHRLFVPASNLKLVVAAAAAHHLDPEFRYRTTLYGTGPVQGGTLAGDLVLYGRGDPLISDRYGRDRLGVWRALADSLLAKGVRRVAGALVADESFFDSVRVRGDWETYDLRWWYAAPTGAIGFNDNSIEFRIQPGLAAGRPARVAWDPPSAYVEVDNRAVTASAGRAHTVDLERVPGTRRIRLYGQVPVNAGTDTEFFAVDDPARFAATVFREVLASRGIAVDSVRVRVVSDPALSPPAAGAPLAEYRSDPLPRVIGPILLNSQNWFAEQLVKTLGREVRGEGSWEAGLAVESDFLTGVVGIDSADFVLRDGSGLSAGNLVTPRALVRLLDYVDRTPRQALVRRALPVSGGDGSLRARFPDLPGRVAAKTGYIGNVDSLSGFVTMAGGRVAIFSIIANKSGQPSARMKAGIDEVVRAIAQLGGR